RRPRVLGPQRGYRGRRRPPLLPGRASGRLATPRTTGPLPRRGLARPRPRVTFPLGPVEVACGRRARRPRFVEETLTRAPWIRRPRRCLTVTTIFRRCWRWALPLRYRSLTIRAPLALAAEHVSCAERVSVYRMETTMSSG